MNYGKKSVRRKQKALTSKTTKIKRKSFLTVFQVILIGVIGVGICGAATAFGMFHGILAGTPSIRLGDVIASGQATIVYDCEGNEIDQYVSTNSNRIQVGMDQIPDLLGKAFVAIEDERIYQHNGIDIKALLRSGYQFVKTGGAETQGASTITQQLLKNTIFTEWTSEGKNMIKKIKRKIQEQYLALEITKQFTKDEVLVRYMNAINLGQNTLGVESASLRYFGKSCSDLTLSECAVIACITQNPSYYNPLRYPENNARRRKDCLDKMLKLEFITKAQYDEAMADTEAVYERIGLYDIDYQAGNSTTGSYFSDAVYEQVKRDLVAAGYTQAVAESMLTSGGLRIETTMDPAIQAIANEEFANPDNYPSKTNWYLTYALTLYDKDRNTLNYSKENMMSWFKKNKDKNFNLIFPSQEDAYAAIDLYRTQMMEETGIENIPENYAESISMTPQPQAALVVSDPTTGYVVAMVGGRGVKEGRRTLNRATSMTRSPGSTFKVLASFGPAIDSAGQTLASVYNDAPFNYVDGTPVNNWYDTGYKGICSIRYGIEQSLNIVAVKTQTVISPQLGMDYLYNFGFTTLTDGVEIGGEIHSDVNQTLALGGLTYGVSPYELNAAYGSIANHGLYTTPKLYTRVTNTKGEEVLDNTRIATRQVIKESTAYLLTDAMVDVVTKGTGTRARFNKKMGIAGKTGSSTGYKDVWFAGFTPYYTCTTWSGYDNNIDMKSSGNNSETKTAQNLWKAVMSRIHEDLPNKEFEQPEDIIEVQICTQSGKLPIPGLCDATLATELFESGTEPIDSCNIHYQGDICSYDGLPASYACPFKYQGIMVLPLLEPTSLLSGSTIIVENPDGTQTINTPLTRDHCQHDDIFMANPNAQSIIQSQQWELQIRAQQAAAQMMQQ